MSSYTENLLRKKIVEDEARLRKGPKKKVVEAIEGIVKIESNPRLESRQMLMILSPLNLN